MKRPFKFRPFGYNCGRKVSFLLLFVSLVVISSCSDKNKNPNEPVIKFLGLYPSTVKAGSSTDSIHVSFSFTDGDADIGFSPQSGEPDIFMTDSRDTAEVGKYNFPRAFDASQFDPKTGIQGVFTVAVPAAFLLLDSLHTHGDTMHYEVYIQDTKFHHSNTVTTTDIYLKP